MNKKLSLIGAGIATIILISAIVVFIKNNRGTPEWLSVRDFVLPQFITADFKERENVIAVKFSEDVDIGYVVNVDSRYQFITQSELDIWEVDLTVLEDTAMRNLDKRSKNINVEVAEVAEQDSTARYVIVELDDGFSAVRLLSSGVRKAIAREVGDEYIAAIPTRDFLIFWHKDFPIFEAFAQQVELEFAAETDYPLTPNLFRVNQYGIQQVKLVEGA